MNANIKLSLAGYYRFEVRRPDGSLRVDTDWIPNIITDAGMNQIGKGVIALYCSVGSGSTAPATTDGTLVTKIATTTVAPGESNTAQATAPYYGSKIFTFVFAQGASAGNLSEVGVGWGSTGNNLFSRALITPTITVLSDEILTVVYAVRVYVPTVDVTGTVSIGGTSRDFVVRAANCTASDVLTGWGVLNLSSAASPNGGIGFLSGSSFNRVYSSTATLGAITGIVTGATPADFTGFANVAYVDGNYYKDITFSLGINDGNVSGGIKACSFQTRLGHYQASFTPVLEKDNTKTLSLTFRVSWARH